jgi:hypothetical protein
MARSGCCILLNRYFGEMAERFKALVSKTSMGNLSHRGFESHSLRSDDFDDVCTDVRKTGRGARVAE